MRNPYPNASNRIRERAFVVSEEAHGDPELAYRLWHKLRPLLGQHSLSSPAQNRPEAARQRQVREENSHPKT